MEGFMLDLGWQELFLITLIALVVVGPKDLPLVIRSVSRWIRKVRGMAREFHETVEEVARETELDEIRAETNQIFVGKLTEFSDDNREMSNVEATYDAQTGSDEIDSYNIDSRLEEDETPPAAIGEVSDPDTNK
ncbi:MAG: twin-arginine translocase subunit TatB [Rhodospirillaceae bacterium]|nr:twin-arginine translocase subunit TatB [Rhodospirillaceae bacterium]|tara:strand:+ start:3562 stop:3963 length:402 start_codon:yes stop_codon:yes gene_type:complete